VELIDFQAIAREMRETVAHWYNAEIEIIDPQTRQTSAEWDPVTNDYAESPEIIIWSGPARIQPIGLTGARLTNMTVMQGAIKNVRVQVPYDEELPLIRKGLEIKVVDGGQDQVLNDLRMIVNSAVNSSYGWNRTIECELDTRSTADG
jgi:hypothetical protein